MRILFITGLFVIHPLGGNTDKSLYSGQRKQAPDSDAKVAGRKSALNGDVRYKILKTYWSEPVSLRAIARRFGVSHMSVWRLVNSSPRPNF
ncbi:hypothetical protein COU37_01640 [Candidatus Micrarchaeota archaeon CG10_big_fil_rev_8_21_14_0_10_45_29]|nr:MAG: hypothetical protein COU37_01640 [Candidatus Micrarchaeota archaeon CG10_big_fil_rev_8_21_14_0_10_45_29]